MFDFSRSLSSNNIAQLKKVHFKDCPLSGDVSFSNNDIGWIEDGTFAHVTSTGSMYVCTSWVWVKMTSLFSLSRLSYIWVIPTIIKDIVVCLKVLEDFSLLNLKKLTCYCVVFLMMKTCKLKVYNFRCFHVIYSDLQAEICGNPGKFWPALRSYYMY